MANTKYCLSWNSYESSICNGLAKLQQSEEFVDMTLVANGYLVKVHKNLLALASPYLKQIIQTAPCEHPIIFFSNISHDVLCYILEFIYTGQVEVEIEKLQAFLAAAEDLKLPSIANFVPSVTKDNEKYTETNEKVPDGNNAELDAGFKYKNCDAGITLSFDDHSYSIENTKDVNKLNDLIQNNDECNPIEHEIAGSSGMQKETINTEVIKRPIEFTIDTSGVMPQQYTVSNRGSLQLILNRYIYSSHHQSLQGRKRRWRCIDYRSWHCQAYIDTIDDTIIKRENIHSHTFHDSKIMKKIKANLIFGSVGTAVTSAKELTDLQVTKKLEDSD